MKNRFITTFRRAALAFPLAAALTCLPTHVLASVDSHEEGLPSSPDLSDPAPPNTDTTASQDIPLQPELALVLFKNHSLTICGHGNTFKNFVHDNFPAAINIINQNANDLDEITCMLRTVNDPGDLKHIFATSNAPILKKFITVIIANDEFHNEKYLEAIKALSLIQKESLLTDNIDFSSGFGSLIQRDLAQDVFLHNPEIAPYIHKLVSDKLWADEILANAITTIPMSYKYYYGSVNADSNDIPEKFRDIINPILNNKTTMQSAISNSYQEAVAYYRNFIFKGMAPDNELEQAAQSSLEKSLNAPDTVVDAAFMIGWLIDRAHEKPKSLRFSVLNGLSTKNMLAIAALSNYTSSFHGIVDRALKNKGTVGSLAELLLENGQFKPYARSFFEKAVGYDRINDVLKGISVDNYEKLINELANTYLPQSDLSPPSPTSSNNPDFEQVRVNNLIDGALVIYAFINTEMDPATSAKLGGQLLAAYNNANENSMIRNILGVLLSACQSKLPCQNELGHSPNFIAQYPIDALKMVKDDDIFRVSDDGRRIGVQLVILPEEEDVDARLSFNETIASLRKQGGWKLKNIGYAYLAEKTVGIRTMYVYVTQPGREDAKTLALIHIKQKGLHVTGLFRRGHIYHMNPYDIPLDDGHPLILIDGGCGATNLLFGLFRRNPDVIQIGTSGVGLTAANDALFLTFLEIAFRGKGVDTGEVLYMARKKVPLVRFIDPNRSDSVRVIRALARAIQ